MIYYDRTDRPRVTRRASQWLEEQSRSCDGVLLLWHARTRRSAASTARGDHEGRDASAGTSTCGSCSMASERLQCQAPPGWFTWRAGKSEEAARGKRPKHGGAPGRPPGQNRAGGGGRLRLKTTHTRPRSGLDGTNQCHACCGVLNVVLSGYTPLVIVIFKFNNCVVVRHPGPSPLLVLHPVCPVCTMTSLTWIGLDLVPGRGLTSCRQPNSITIAVMSSCSTERCTDATGTAAAAAAAAAA